MMLHLERRSVARRGWRVQVAGLRFSWDASARESCRPRDGIPRLGVSVLLVLGFGRDCKSLHV